MARKIIKAILFILAAVVVAGGIMTYLRSQKKITAPVVQAPKTEAPKPQVSQIGEVVINAQGATAAQVQIQGIKERNFNISNLPNGDGFKIQVPHAQLAQTQKLLDKPHPLIKKIEVHESAENPTTAELIFYTEKNVNFLDTQKGDTLTIDFVKTDAPAETAKVDDVDAPKETSKTSSKSSAAAKASSKKAKAAVSKKSSKLSKSTAKKSKSSSGSNAGVKLKPFDASMVDDTELDAQTETLVPQGGGTTQTDRSMDLSAFGTTPSTETIPLGQEEIPTIEPDTAFKPSEDDNDGFNVKDVAKEEPKVPVGSANLLDAETEMSLKDNAGGSGAVAALPQNQKFDLNKLQSLPALQNLTVQRAGTATVITFDREKPVPYKVFRMVNPSRIVVDFKDAKNSLKPDYPRFAGTKISRIETRAYAGADGMLVRVIMYVDGAPNYTSDKKGNQLVLQLN
jgi:hypothetical protein